MSQERDNAGSKLISEAVSGHLARRKDTMLQVGVGLSALAALNLLGIDSPEATNFSIGLAMNAALRLLDFPRIQALYFGTFLATTYVILPTPAAGAYEALFMATGNAYWDLAQTGAKIVGKGSQRLLSR